MTEARDPERPLSPQEFYGEELRLKREAAGLTQSALGEKAVCSGSLIAHFEAGRRRPHPDVAQRIDAALSTDGFFARMRRRLDTMQFAHHFANAAEHERLAVCIQEYAATIVPGLLQTEAYARAIFRGFKPNATADDVDRRVVNRLERARILDNPETPAFWAMLDESVLRRPVGGPSVMAEQLRHIAQLGRSGRVRVHVLPYSVGAHSVMEGMLTLMRFTDAPPVAYVEGVRTGRLHDDPATVASCQAAYDLALGDALSARASLALIESVAEEYEHED